MPRPAARAFHERLDELLDASIGLTLGPELPADPSYEILVSGRPEREQIAASPRLRAVLIPYAGLPASTRELMLEHPDIAVHNLHHNAAPTAELAITLMLAVAKRVIPIDRALRSGDWSPRYDDDASGMLLSGRRVLVLGHGAIGRRVARACVALGMRVNATRRRATEVTLEREVTLHPASALGELLPDADIVCVCLPQTPETTGLLGAEELALLPRGAILVNVARGHVVDEQALYEALVGGALGGAGLDAWYHYPAEEKARTCTPPSEFPFGDLDSVVLSPHRAGHSDRTEDLRASHLAAALDAAARGEEMPGRVDVLAGY
jgi:phosphoglycerate dehydrogenase-like enzyme